MENGIFNTDKHQTDIASKIVVGLERISEVFRALLWEHGKTIGLSPIQIQILIFIAYHQSKLCSVSHLSKEFNVTKPTISDAVKVLLKKELIQKEHSSEDQRKYHISLTLKGKKIVEETEHFAEPIKKQLAFFEEKQLNSLFDSLSHLLFQLHKNQILPEQRLCMACKHFIQNKEGMYCQLLEQALHSSALRVDCPEFESKPK